MKGRQFGSYQLLRVLASGGISETFLARKLDADDDQPYVALKMIHPNLAVDEQFVHMFIDEAKIAILLQHPNIARTFELGQAENSYYLTTEYVDGYTLDELFARTSARNIPIPFELAAHIVRELAAGLAYAHGSCDEGGQPLDIVHRDVTPKNVMLTHSGEVKLVNFSLAKASNRERQTAIGVIKGTYQYMSPEQIAGKTVDLRSDIYSAGILLHELLAGQVLYAEDNMARLVKAILESNPSPPSTVRADTPPALDRIALRALRKHLDERYASAAELANELGEYLGDTSPSAMAPALAAFIAEVFGTSANAAVSEPPEPPIAAAGGAQPAPQHEPTSPAHREPPADDAHAARPPLAAEPPPAPPPAARLESAPPPAHAQPAAPASSETARIPALPNVSPHAASSASELPPARHETMRTRAVVPSAPRDARRLLPRWGWIAAATLLGAAVVTALFVLLADQDRVDYGTTTLSVTTIPAGARVTINGEPQPGTSPMVVEGIQRGAQYHIIAELPGFQRWELRVAVAVEDTKPVTVTATLQPLLEPAAGDRDDRPPSDAPAP